MRLKWFGLGILVTLIVFAVAAYVYLEKGFVSIRADIKHGTLDPWLMAAMDASARRHAPNVENPVPDTPENLLAAAKVYASRCVVCHGGPAAKRSELGEAFSPPAPQFFSNEPPDMMENENYYIIKHGVRMTAMPAWDKLVSDKEIWLLVGLLKHINDKTIPPEVEQELRQPGR